MTDKKIIHETEDQFFDRMKDTARKLDNGEFVEASETVSYACPVEYKAASLEETAAEYQKGQEQKRQRREAGIPEPRFIDYIGLIGADGKHEDLTQTDEQREQWKKMRESMRENFIREHKHDDETLAYDIEAGYFDVVHGKMRTPGLPSSIPHVVGFSTPNFPYGIYDHQRQAIDRMLQMKAPIFYDLPRGLGKGGFGGHADDDDIRVEYDFEATIDWPTRFKELMKNAEKMQLNPLLTIDSIPEGFGHRCGKPRTELAMAEYIHTMVQFETPEGREYVSLHFGYKRLHEAGKKHEAICKEILKQHKKRRKALRKQLDIIGSEYK